MSLGIRYKRVLLRPAGDLGSSIFYTGFQFEGEAKILSQGMQHLLRIPDFRRTIRRTRSGARLSYPDDGI